MLKGTIFEKGNKWQNKLHRHLAWIRGRSYALRQSPKDYKRGLIYQLIGAITVVVAELAALWAGIFGVIIGIAWLKDLISKKLEKKRKEKD